MLLKRTFSSPVFFSSHIVILLPISGQLQFSYQHLPGSMRNSRLTSPQAPPGRRKTQSKMMICKQGNTSDEKREKDDDYQSIFAVEKRKCPFIFLEKKNAIINDEIKEKI